MKENELKNIVCLTLTVSVDLSNELLDFLIFFVQLLL